MVRRAIGVGLLLLVTQLSTGCHYHRCFCRMHRPILAPLRCHPGIGACGPVDCCDTCFKPGFRHGPVTLGVPVAPDAPMVAPMPEFHSAPQPLPLSPGVGIPVVAPSSPAPPLIEENPGREGQ